MNTNTTNKDLSKSIYKNTNISTNYRTTYEEELQTQISNNTIDDFLMIKTSEFKNDKEYKKHIGSKSKDKTINCLMNHIVI